MRIPPIVADGERPAGTPKVSVIIPTFNRAHYLGDAIDSVLQQTLADVEIIVVDDGSTDDTERVVASFGAQVIYERTANGGVAHARNVGIRRARGTYFAFLDSDDLFYPYMLEVESRLLDLCDRRMTRRRDYAARARKYLARCARYGHPQWMLWALTFAPGPVRRFGVSMQEILRSLRQRLRQRLRLPARQTAVR